MQKARNWALGKVHVKVLSQNAALGLLYKTL